MKDILLKWRRIHSASQPKSRHGHRAVNIDDKMIVFGGGNEGLVGELHVFNTTNCQWYVPVTQGEHPPDCAAFGFAVYENRIFLFGGIVQHSKFSNELYELTYTNWNWQKLKPEPPQNGIPPCPRLGHSFTCVADKIFLFGGLTKQTDDDNPIYDIPIYLNDLYILDICGGVTKWEMPPTFGISPPPRESHSSVAYINKKTKNSNLVIYGGMSGCRLGDVWLLDTNAMMWCHLEIKGVAPLPRSLHTATLMDQRMYIFGGWVPITVEENNDNTFNKKWACTNTLACLNLETMVWEETVLNTTIDIPRARAGHCSVGIYERLYIWSGRDGCNVDWNNPVCCKDLWYLEVKPPENAPCITLVQALSDFIELKWLEIPITQVYLLEIQRLDSPLTVPHLKEEQHNLTSLVSHMPSVTTLSSIRDPLLTNKPIQSTTTGPRTAPAYTNNLMRFETTFQQSNKRYPIITQTESDNEINEKQLNVSSSCAKSPYLAINQKELTLPQSLLQSKHNTISSEINSINLHVQPKKCIIGGKSYIMKPVTAVAQRSLKSCTLKTFSDQSTLIPSFNNEHQESKQQEMKQFDSVDPRDLSNILILSLSNKCNDKRNQYSSSTEKWCTVGFFTERSCSVFNYIDYDEWNSTQYNDITTDSIPDLSTKLRINIEPRTGYKFRLSAINGCGRGSFGNYISCITCLPKLPCSPTEFKISKLVDGVRLSWEPNILFEKVEYSIYLVVNSTNSDLALRRVYCGSQFSCNIPNSALEAAYIEYDHKSKPAKFFRIWARNDNGYGPFTQIRYLQESKAVTDCTNTRNYKRFKTSQL